MNNARAQRESVCRDAADAIDGASDLATRASALVGFDAFVDRIIDVVDVRHAPGAEGYTRLPTIDSFGARVAGASGRSGNFELVATREKLGGNAAILASALARVGADVVFLGAAGLSDEANAVHPVFESFAAECRECIPLAAPGQTDALEFDDGKIMLGKPAPLDHLTWDRLLNRAGGVDGLRRRCAKARVLAFGNWTMHRALDDIWRRLARDVLETMPAPDRPIMTSIDLADPARRADAEIGCAIDALNAIHALTPVTLGLNLAEAERIGAIAGVSLDLPGGAQMSGVALQKSAAALRGALGFSCVVVHGRRRSACATSQGAASFDAPYTSKPVISTGAGDHFNAGFVLGAALDLPLGHRLACASACAGRYVRTGVSPSRRDLIAMLQSMPEPENGA